MYVCHLNNARVHLTVVIEYRLKSLARCSGVLRKIKENSFLNLATHHVFMNFWVVLRKEPGRLCLQ